MSNGELVEIYEELQRVAAKLSVEKLPYVINCYDPIVITINGTKKTLQTLGQVIFNDIKPIQTSITTSNALKDTELGKQIAADLEKLLNEIKSEHNKIRRPVMKREYAKAVLAAAQKIADAHPEIIAKENPGQKSTDNTDQIKQNPAINRVKASEKDNPPARKPSK